MKTRVPFLVVACSVAFATQVRATDLDAVKAAWEADLVRFNDLSVEYTTKASVKNGADISHQEHKSVAKKLGPNRLGYMDQKPTSVSVSVANEQYFFVAKESSHGEWTFGTYGKLDDVKVSKPLKRLVALSDIEGVMYSISGIPLYSNLDAFRVDSETEDVLTLISTRDLESNEGTNKIRLSKIKLQLDKKNSFRLISATCIQQINKSTCDLTVAYQTDSSTDQSQQSTVTTSETYTDIPGLKIDATTEYKFQLRAGLKESDFRLAAYGLPEPNDIVWKKPTPIYLWLLVAAGGLAVAALLFRWLAQRRQQPAQAAA